VSGKLFYSSLQSSLENFVIQHIRKQFAGGGRRGCVRISEMSLPNFSFFHLFLFLFFLPLLLPLLFPISLPVPPPLPFLSPFLIFLWVKLKIKITSSCSKSCVLFSLFLVESSNIVRVRWMPNSPQKPVGTGATSAFENYLPSNDIIK